MYGDRENFRKIRDAIRVKPVRYINNSLPTNQRKEKRKKSEKQSYCLNNN